MSWYFWRIFVFLKKKEMYVDHNYYHFHNSCKIHIYSRNLHQKRRKRNQWETQDSIVDIFEEFMFSLEKKTNVNALKNLIIINNIYILISVTH